jgi:hypothetical protein
MTDPDTAHHPVVESHLEQRATDLQLRVAETITNRPEPAGRVPKAKADHDFVEQELELKTNTELTRAVHALTTEIHRRLITEPDPHSAGDR